MSHMYIFEEKRHVWIGTISILIPVSNTNIFAVLTSISEENVLFLIRLGFSSDLNALSDIKNNKVAFSKREWEASIERKLGHLFEKWRSAVLPTTAEMRKIHCHFSRHTSQKVFKVLYCAGLDEIKEPEKDWSDFS